MSNERGSCETKSGNDKSNACCVQGSCCAQGSGFKFYYKSFAKMLKSLAIFNGIGLFVSLYWFTQVQAKAPAAAKAATDTIMNTPSFKCAAFCFSIGLALAFFVLVIDLLCMLRCFCKAQCKKSNCCPTSCMGGFFLVEYLLALGSTAFFGYGLYTVMILIMAM